MYDKIVKIISQYEEKGDFTHPNVDDKDLYDAEKILNSKIPEQYVWFLKNSRNLSFPKLSISSFVNTQAKG